MVLMSLNQVKYKPLFPINEQTFFMEHTEQYILRKHVASKLLAPHNLRQCGVCKLTPFSKCQSVVSQAGGFWWDLFVVFRVGRITCKNYLLWETIFL